MCTSPYIKRTLHVFGKSEKGMATAQDDQIRPRELRRQAIVPAKNQRDFDPKRFLTTIGEAGNAYSSSRNKQSSLRETRLTQSSTSSKARLNSLSYRGLVRKPPSGY
jgi:hypothetical protein